MKKCYLKIVSGTALAVMFLFASCHSAYEVTKAEGRMQPIDSTYDVAPDAEAMALLAPYKAKIDSMMYRVVGTAEMSMDKGAPESLLSNLVADVLRGAAAQVLGKPADILRLEGQYHGGGRVFRQLLDAGFADDLTV